MSEQMSPLSQEAIDVAWDAAQAANSAHTALTRAERVLIEVQGVAELGVEGIKVADEAWKVLEDDHDFASADFYRLSSMAGIVMFQAVDGDPQKSPWSYRETKADTEETPDEAETRLRQEVENEFEVDTDPKTKKKLESLPQNLRDRVALRYNQKSAAVAEYVRQGKLPEDYLLPDLSVLIERVMAVAPTFEHMQYEEGWQPEIVFVPQDLSPEQWNGLIEGQKLPDGSTMNGTYRSFSGETSDPTNSKPDANSLWDVAVIDTGHEPTYLNISKDGTHGSNAKKAVKALAKLPSVKDNSSAEIIVAQVSPREEVYNALQLSLLEQGEWPVDRETWTISKENVTVGGGLGSVLQSFNPDYRQVYSAWSYRDDAGDDGGVRASASGRDILKPRS
jgi:hypothetical protein